MRTIELHFAVIHGVALYYGRLYRDKQLILETTAPTLTEVCLTFTEYFAEREEHQTVKPEELTGIDLEFHKIMENAA